MGDSALRGIRKWLTWGRDSGRAELTADDTLLTNWRASLFDRDKAISIPDDGTAIAVRLFGLTSDGDTATLRFTGWMDPDSKGGGVGPGFVLWQGQVQLGTHVFASSEVLQADGKSVARLWREADVWNSAIANGNNAAGAVLIPDTVRQQAMLEIPTHGFRFVTLEVDDIGAGGTTMARLAVLYRTIATEGVLV